MAVTCALSSPIQVSLVPNGAPAVEPGEVVMASSWTDIAEALTSSSNPSLSTLGSKWWLATSEGKPLHTWEDMLEVPSDKRCFSVVPFDRLFQWRPRPIGEKVKVDLSDRDGASLETVSVSPRIFLIHDLFTTEEAEAIKESALRQNGTSALQKSGVGFKTSGRRMHGNFRTSDNAFDTNSDIALRLAKRAFEVVKVPYNSSLQDGLQILRYQPGQAYQSHTDWFDAGTGTANGQDFDSSNIDGSNRWATVFFYFQAPPSGGFTVFPEAKVDASLEETSSKLIQLGKNRSREEAALEEALAFYGSKTWEVDLVKECYSSLAIKPVELGALLFYHQDPITGKLLQEAKHGACPSFSGTKWGANFWIWNKPRHLTPQNQVSAKFINKAEFAVELQYSMDTGDSWVMFAKIPAGSSSSSNTYSGHWWRFLRDDSREEVQRWVAPERRPEATFVYPPGSLTKAEL